MKHLILLVVFFLSILLCKAQLYIDTTFIVQYGATVYVQDTIKLASPISVFGTLQSTKGINTNGNVVYTQRYGTIVTPIPSYTTKTFDIGSTQTTSTNNRIQIHHTTGSSVVFTIAVRDDIYLNPQNKTTQITSNVVNKTWYVSPQSSVTNLKTTLYWNSSDELTGFTRTNCGVGDWVNGTSTFWGFSNGTSAATSTIASPKYSKIASTLASATYYLGVGSNTSSLPVTSLKFDATKLTDGNILLNWSTLAEINNDHFELERSNSSDSILLSTSWEKVATIKGSLNSNIEENYSFIDDIRNLNALRLYYRLKQIDINGSATFSDIKEVDVGYINSHPSFMLSCYPNPNKENLFIDIESATQRKVIIHLFDANGKNIDNNEHLIERGYQSIQINTSHLYQGVYLLVITDESNGILGKQKVIVYSTGK